MSVIRIEKNRNYSVIHNEFLRNKELSLKAKGLLAMCLSLPDDWNYNIRGLVSLCKESLTSVRSSLKELEEHGYVVITKRNDEKGRFTYDYTIYEVPVAENTALVNQPLDKQPTENMNLLSKEKEITKKESTNDLSIYIREQAPAPLWSLLHDYLEVRNEKGKPLNLRSLKILLNRLAELSNNNITMQRLMLENAIQNGWANVYRPKDQEIEAASKALVENLKSFYGI
jgi:hypothetical protein